jgi:hypothetical protein
MNESPVEVWAEEGNMRFRIMPHRAGDVILQMVDVSSGWPGKVVSEVTIAQFRRQRLADALTLEKMVP